MPAEDEHRLYPKDILGTVFLRTMSIAEIAVEARFPNPTIGLKEVVDLLAESGVRVLALNLTIKGDRQFLTAFIEYSSIKSSPRDLVEELRKARHVSEVRFKTKRVEEKIVDEFATPTFDLGNLPAMILSKEEFGRVLSEIKERYGTGGCAFLYIVGYRLGELSGEKYGTERVSKEFVMEDVLAFQAFGWGVPEVVELNLLKPRVRLRFYNLFESVGTKGRSDEPFCHFFRGYLAGLFSKFFGREVTVREIKCVAMGDAYCEFIIESK